MLLPLLVLGSGTPVGSKIVKFLRDHQKTVYGADRIEQENDNKANKFFKMDLRNKDAMRFLFEFTDAKTIVFCGQHLTEKATYVVVDYNYQIYLNMITHLSNKHINNLIVISNYGGDKPQTPVEVSWHAINLLTEVFTKAFSLNTLVIKPKDNLYKNIRNFLQKGGETDGWL